MQRTPSPAEDIARPRIEAIADAYGWKVECEKPLYRVPRKASWDNWKLDFEPYFQEQTKARYYLDFFLSRKDCKIDIEIDGAQWHQDKEKDERRDELVTDLDIQVFRIPARWLMNDREFTALIESILGMADTIRNYYY